MRAPQFLILTFAVAIFQASAISQVLSKPSPATVPPDIRSIPTDLNVPAVTGNEPGPGQRVLRYLNSCDEPNLYYSLYLPTDWEHGKKYPLIVEYPGNGPYKNAFGDQCSGRLEDCNLGYGISGGQGMIWICLPFVDTQSESQKHKQQLQWWGDVQATVDYCKSVVSQVVDKYGADPDQVFLAGFSRGSIACNFIGLHDGSIASLWAGFICHSHYDGVRNWGYPDGDRKSAFERLKRLRGRPQWISHEMSIDTTREFLEQSGESINATFVPLPYRNHTDTWVLRDLPERKKIREWMQQVLQSKEGKGNSTHSTNTKMEQALFQLQNDLIKSGACLSNTFKLSQRGQTIYERSVHSTVEGDKAITDETLFPIWSMTKPITSVAAMMLFDRGAFKLDDPVKDVLPQLANMRVRLPAGGTESMRRPITYRDLLRHTSGIYGYDGSFDEEGTWKQVMELENLDQFLDLIASQPLQHQPGERYTYGLSNAVLGAAIEKISGLSLMDFFQKNLFIPLKMEHTQFQLSKADREKFQPLFVKTKTGYRPGTPAEDELHYLPGSRLQLGGEGLVSTMSDYGKFCQMLVDRGRAPDGTVILSETALDLMLSDQLGEGVQGFGGGEYGFVQGLGFQILKQPEKNGNKAPAGIFGWGGYHTTHFWIDPENEIYGLFMTRRYPFNGEIEGKLQETVYTEIER
jgi:CubicO group peptidase (beta-lactamase class C family)